jgi:chemotaxis protein MotB
MLKLKKILLPVVCLLICFLASSCAFTKRYFGLESKLRNAEQHLERKDEELKNMESKLQDLKKDLKKVNLNLSNKIKKLKLELKKKETIIQLQSEVIRLFDDHEKTIETSLRKKIKGTLAKIDQAGGKTKVFSKITIFFNSGSVRLDKKEKKQLLKLANSIKKNKGQNIVVEGHTDNFLAGAPAKRKKSTNWALSTMRAIAVVRFLEEEAGLAPERLAVVGYGSSRPVASNNTKEGRRLNRRVEVVLEPPI